MIRIVSSSRYHINRKSIRLHLDGLYTKYSLSQESTVHVVFVGKVKMKSIAKNYKQEDVALPVLAFPYRNDPDTGEQLLGEIFLCYPQIILLAAERNKRLDILINELIEHGLKNVLK